MTEPKKKLVIFPDDAQPPLGETKYGYIVTNCNSCWALIDDRLAICPNCGKKTF